MANTYFAEVYVKLQTLDTVTSASVQPAATYNPVTVYNGYKVWYEVNVYVNTTVTDINKWKTLSTAAKGTLLTSDGVDKAKMTLTKNSTDSNIKVGKTVQVNSHLEASILRDFGSAGGTATCTPTIAITQNHANSNIDTPVTNVVWRNSKGVAPTLAWTARVGPPEWPKTTVQNFINSTWGTALAANGNVTVSDKYWEQCNNRWAIYINSAHLDGLATVYYMDRYGEKAPTVAKAFPKPATMTANAKATHNQVNDALFTTIKTGLSCSGDVASNTLTGGYDSVNVSTPQDTSRWNPPPHAASRSVPYNFKVPAMDPHGNLITDTLGNILKSSNYDPAFSITNGKYNFLERGRIFQDSVSAEIMNKTDISLDKKTGKAAAWGFRFMYNPTYISYSTSGNNSIDWSIGSKDSATVLAGNQTVRFQLYINRIADMSYLMDIERNGNNSTGMQTMYGRNLREEEVAGILHRGTEYDIEFLYRVLTGDPIPTNPLLNKSWVKGRANYASADIGYVTGVPLWMYLSDNLRYYGAVTAISVNHAIFTTEMVPMLTTVDIDFLRYPAEFAANSDNVKAAAKSLST